MKVERKFIDAILESNGNNYLYTEDLYLPIQIMLENLRVGHYVEIRLLHEFYVEQIPTEQLCKVYQFDETRVTDIITHFRDMIINSIPNAINIYPKKEWDIVTSSDAVVACHNAGVGVIYLNPEDKVTELKLDTVTTSMLISNRVVTVNQLYALNKKTDLYTELSGCTKKQKQKIIEALDEYCEALREEVI